MPSQSRSCVCVFSSAFKLHAKPCIAKKKLIEFMSAAKQRRRLSSKNIKDGFFRTLSPPPPSDRKVHIFLLCRCYFPPNRVRFPQIRPWMSARAKSTSELKDWQKRQCPERGGGERCNASISRSRLHACEAAKGQGRAGALDADKTTRGISARCKSQIHWQCQLSIRKCEGSGNRAGDEVEGDVVVGNAWIRRRGI